MSTMNQAVGIHAVREFFSTDEWNLLFDALDTYQYYTNEEEESDALMNKISDLFKN